MKLAKSETRTQQHHCIFIILHETHHKIRKKMLAKTKVGHILAGH